MDKAELRPHLDRFGPFLRVEKALSARSRDLYLRIIQRFLLGVGTATPTKEQLYQRLSDLYERDYSRTHMRNIQIAVELYMEHLGAPVTFRRPKKKRTVVGSTLTEAEVAVLIAAAKNIREKAIIALLACSGIRNQELCDLKVRDVDLTQNLVRILDGKGQGAGFSAISAECVSVVVQYLQQHPRGEGDYLFTTLRGGGQYSTTALRRLLKKLGERAGLGKRVYPHLLRHTLATTLLRRGATPLAVQKQLRHRHLATTLLYIHSGHIGNYRREIAFFQPAYL